MTGKAAREPVQVTRRMIVASVVLLTLVLVMGAAALISSYLENKHYETQLSNQNKHFEFQLSAQIRSQQESQERQSKSEQARLCSSLTGLSQLKAPNGSAAGSSLLMLSIAFEQNQQKKLSELSSDIGCR
jgi:flagellar basal body-associated protein FliL